MVEIQSLWMRFRFCQLSEFLGSQLVSMRHFQPVMIFMVAINHMEGYRKPDRLLGQLPHGGLVEPEVTDLNGRLDAIVGLDLPQAVGQLPVHSMNVANEKDTHRS